MIEIAICDDDPSITGFLDAAIQEAGSLLPEPLHVQVFNRGAAVLAAIKKAAGERRGAEDAGGIPFDIIFLDIELGDTTGIAVAEEIRKKAGPWSGEGPALVFVSAHESYCKQLFQFDTAAFLSKPIDGAEVKSLLLRLYKYLRNPRQVFYYRINDEMRRMPLSDILYFESKERKIEIVTKTDAIEPSARTFYGKLNEVEAQLKHPGFIRIHASMLVNLDNVDRLEKNALIFPGGRTLTPSRGRQKEVRAKIAGYFATGVKP